MNWLTPLGFLGLISLIVLIIIYIIKPNYQNKIISSTFVWKLSLKYKKQRLHVSKVQNLLMFICQVLILSILGLLLAGPVAITAVGEDDGEVVLIVDASAGMRLLGVENTETEETTRFERALAKAEEEARRTFKRGSRVTLILADETPELLLRRVGSEESDSAIALIKGLYAEGADACSYGSANMNEAITLAEGVLEENSAARVYLYTGTDYTYHDGVETVKISAEEWNGAILDCTAELDDDNHYEITVSAALYGKTDIMTVYCAVHGVNGDPERTVLAEPREVPFDPTAREKEIVFTTDDFSEGAIYSYEYIEAYVSLRDALPDDNYFFLYGGERPIISVQYASSMPNNFFESAIRSLRQSKREVWDIRFTSLGANETAATEGFDIYIFEHRMPDVLPTDGVVILVDPDRAPLGSELQIGGSYRVESSSHLSPGTSHAITKYVDPTRVTISKYNDILLNEGYEELAFYNGRPVMLLRESEGSRVLVWAFDLNYSNLIALPDFSILIYNTFNYFITDTFVGTSFEVGDTVDFNGRGTGLTVSVLGEEHSFPSGEGELLLTRPGTYTATQTDMDGKTEITEEFFVRIPTPESDVARVADTLPSVERSPVLINEYRDLLLYFAIALVLLMFAEWALEIKKNY